jgi:hypothetical protein
MANPTTNYGWPMPTSTDLVTDLPADFAAFGQPVDTSLKALNPETTLGDIAYRSATANTNTRLPIGTTGQVLSVVGGVPAWTTGTTGDIEGVTAGVGISGGGTSGTVTVTNSMATAITTAGDLIKGTGSGTFDRLGIGSTGQVLTVSSGAPAWATPAGGGKVLQVINATYGTQTGSTSTTYADTGLTATITPTSSTSKILVIANQSGVGKWNNNDFVFVRLNRGSTALTEFSAIAGYTGTVSYNMIGGVGTSYLDSPATTSATVYKTQFKSNAGGQVYVQQNGDFSSITLMEIGA